MKLNKVRVLIVSPFENEISDITNALARREVKHVDATGNSIAAERLILSQDYNLAFLALEMDDQALGSMYGLKIAELIRRDNKQTQIYGFCHSSQCEANCNYVWAKNGFDFMEANGSLDENIEKILKKYK